MSDDRPSAGAPSRSNDPADALAAFGSPHHSYGASICHGLNRLSSLVYYLELRLMARRTGVGGG